MTRLLAVLAFLAVAAVGCAEDKEPAAKPSPTPSPAKASPQRVITVTSTAFAAGEPIPQKYACTGQRISPPLAWSGVPAGSGTLALVMEDTTGRLYHWIVVNIPASVAGAAEGQLPQGGQIAATRPYLPPCPRAGALSRYVFTVYALPGPIDLAPDVNESVAVQKVVAAATALGDLTGTYQR